MNFALILNILTQTTGDNSPKECQEEGLINRHEDKRELTLPLGEEGATVRNFPLHSVMCC